MNARHAMNLRLPIGLSAALLASPVSASVVTYFNDYAGWSAAAGPTTMIDFVPPGGTAQVVPGDFYQDFGVTLSGFWTMDAVPWALTSYWTQATDGWSGLPAGFPTQTMGALNFGEPIRAFAMDKIVATQGSVKFYLGDSLILTGVISVPAGQFSQNHFFGWITDFDFDRVVFNGGINGGADNVYFSTIPAPGALALGVIATLAAGRRRRR